MCGRASVLFDSNRVIITITAQTSNMGWRTLVCPTVVAPSSCTQFNLRGTTPVTRCINIVSVCLSLCCACASVSVRRVFCRHIKLASFKQAVRSCVLACRAEVNRSSRLCSGRPPACPSMCPHRARLANVCVRAFVNDGKNEFLRWRAICKAGFFGGCCWL